jgi:NAD(P)-dependent dehydrogenase (short-subunit alcohol dehydrogenase family)
VKANDLFSLHSVTALVTGASGGLGEHFALTLADAGAKVALAARGPAPLDRLARKINETGGCAVAIHVDVTNASMVAQGFAAAEQALGTITLLVNNSGTTATGLTRSLALELARYEIRVNALAPGYIATQLNRQFLATPSGQNLIKRIPERRLGELKDLEGPRLLLASGASRFMTGAVIPVDGGHLVNTL